MLGDIVLDPTQVDVLTSLVLKVTFTNNKYVETNCYDNI